MSERMNARRWSNALDWTFNMQNDIARPLSASLQTADHILYGGGKIRCNGSKERIGARAARIRRALILAISPNETPVASRKRALLQRVT